MKESAKSHITFVIVAGIVRPVLNLHEETGPLACHEGGFEP